MVSPKSGSLFVVTFRAYADNMVIGLTNVVAGSQIRQLGEDKQPFDGSKPENAEKFQKDMETWMSDMQSGKRSSGYVDVTFDSVPYLGPAVA